MSGHTEHDLTARIVEEVDDTNAILRRLRTRPVPADLPRLLEQRLRAEGLIPGGLRPEGLSPEGHEDASA